MSELLTASLAFPSVVLTILVGITFLYWVFVILGALDIDIFHADADIDGALDGHGHVGHDIGGHDVGGGDAGDAGDGDGGGDVGDASTFLKPLGLRRVPLTISLTFVFVFSWTICLLTMHYLGAWIPDGILRWVFGAGVLFGSLFFSLPLTAIAITPIAPAFVVALANRHRDNVGSTCSVTTGRVDQSFGQAKITAGGAELVISVRCDDEGMFSRDDKALVIDYDEQRHAYIIEPLPDSLKKQSKDK